jgi:nicotinate dehydrogenase subunit A
VPQGQGQGQASSRPDWSRPRAAPDPETVFHLRVNGHSREVTCRRETPMLYLLRNDLGLKGSRFGCGLGQCGACMVLLDGHPTPSCDLPVWAAEGHDVVTIEGLSDDPVMQALQEAFIHRQAAQCGYCMSGILVSACALLRSDPGPPRTDIADALDRNLCRCGSHGRVLGAVEDAARTVRAQQAGEQPTEHDRQTEGAPRRLRSTR